MGDQQCLEDARVAAVNIRAALNLENILGSRPSSESPHQAVESDSTHAELEPRILIPKAPEIKPPICTGRSALSSQIAKASWLAGPASASTELAENGSPSSPSKRTVSPIPPELAMQAPSNYAMRFVSNDSTLSCDSVSTADLLMEAMRVGNDSDHDRSDVSLEERIESLRAVNERRHRETAELVNGGANASSPDMAATLNVSTLD